jgi:cytochrome c oxidase subunit 2
MISKALLNITFSYSYCDAAEPWQFGLQEPATPIMESMIDFHNYIMGILIVVAVLITWMLARALYLFNEKSNPIAQKFSHDPILEICWTIFPAFVLLLIAIPSFTLLYSLDEVIEPDLTIKIVGHQWYWSYEYTDFAILGKKKGTFSLGFDSYMVKTEDLLEGTFRLLEVDNRLLLPINVHIRLLITAADVLHSWAVPSFGIKIDACPGRLSQGSLFIKRPGMYYGQCSEICGANHGFMPIVVHALPEDFFGNWLFRKVVAGLDQIKEA